MQNTQNPDGPGDPVVNTRGLGCLELFQAAPVLGIGTILVYRQGRPWVAVITGFTERGYPILEFDSDGSIHDYWTMSQVTEMFTVWHVGMAAYDPTGKGIYGCKT